MNGSRICYLSNSGAVGGVEQHILDLVRGFVEGGLGTRSYTEVGTISAATLRQAQGKPEAVFVICPAGPMAESYRDAGATVISDYPRFDIDPFYILRLIRFFRRNRIDILHAHQLKTVVNGLIAAGLAGVPLKIAHIHTPLSQWQISPVRKAINIFVNQIVINLCADKVIALTETVKRERVREEGIREEKIVVLPNGVDISKFEIRNPKLQTNSKSEILSSLPCRQAGKQIRVGTLGRVTVEKNHQCFINSVRSLAISQSRNFVFLLAGDGPLRPRLERQARDLGVFDQIEFLGFLPEDQKASYLAGLDIFVLPSLAEGFGIALIEAMAAGCACVASDLPVLKEVGGDIVLYFKTDDAKDLTAKIRQLVGDERQRQKLGERARRRVEEEYSMERFIESYRALYETTQ